MALDFNQRSFTRTANEGVIDEGLRAYMLKVYNYMTTGLLITGLIAFFFGKASIFTNSNGELIGFTSLGNMLFNSPLMWVVALAPLGMMFFFTYRINRMS